MDFNLFKEQEVKNKKGLVGVVASFDKYHIVIRYSSGEKIYSTDIAFKSGFIFFKNKELNKIIKEELFLKNEVIKKEQETRIKVEKYYRIKINLVNDIYRRMLKKNRVLLSLFGSDFVYPPLIKFEKKYKRYIDRNINKGWEYSRLYQSYYE